MESRKALIDYIIGNEFISKPELQKKFIDLLDKHEQTLQLKQTGVSSRLLAEKIILALDDYGRKVHSVEYGLPIDPDTKDFEDKRPQEMLKIVTNILNGC